MKHTHDVAQVYYGDTSKLAEFACRIDKYGVHRFPHTSYIVPLASGLVPYGHTFLAQNSRKMYWQDWSSNQ
jgi:hypothetical protein